jgi:DNA-binding HxlR family transcriptional regulator/antitoxin (DNA-binding transcriptional repressor) of toxin-antitoxin stability system
MDTTPRSGCPINAAVEVLGDPWAMLVLRDIMFGNRRHFRELIAGSEEGIATNILASRLKQLVAAGLLTRDDARRGQRAAYSLTEAGIQVLPVMVALGNWGLAHRHGERRLRVCAELLRDGGPELVAAMMDELRELHLGVPRPGPDAPRASDQLRAAYEAAFLDTTSSGETVQITDRGRPVALLTPLPQESPLDQMRSSGEIEPATASADDLPDRRS